MTRTATATLTVSREGTARVRVPSTAEYAWGQIAEVLGASSSWEVYDEEQHRYEDEFDITSEEAMEALAFHLTDSAEEADEVVTAVLIAIGSEEPFSRTFTL